MSSPVAFGVVGSGWRAHFYVRLAQVVPEQLRVVGVMVRSREAADRVTTSWNVPAFLSLDEMLRADRPDFVISSVPREANPDLLAALVGLGLPVLSETPPAADEDALRSLWDRVGRRRLVQVAEQYPLYPGHAARLELVRRETLGTATSVYVSSTHDYHAVALMRAFLGAGYGPTTVTASRFAAPLIDTSSREGWTDESEPKDAENTIATIDFGDGRSGLYDFTDNQWHNQLRMRRIAIRGSAGELVGDDVVRWGGPRTIVRSTLNRRQIGHDLDLDGYDTDHLNFEGEILFRNPFVGLRLSDEEIAILSLLKQMAAWCSDEGPEPYPLAEGCQDHLISLAIHASGQMGVPVRTAREPWSSVAPARSTGE